MPQHLLASTPGLGLVVPLLVLVVTVGAVVLSVLGRWWLPQVAGWKIYLLSPLVSAGLLYGYYALRLLLDAAAAPAGAAYRAAAAQLEEGFRLEGWSVELHPARPVLWVEYAVPTSAKVAVTVIAGSRPTEAGRYPQWHYLGQSDPQRTVRAVQPGEIYRVEVPLERYTPGEPEAFVLTFELESGLSSGVFVKKIYATYPIDVLGQRSLRLPPPREARSG